MPSDKLCFICAELRQNPKAKWCQRHKRVVDTMTKQARTAEEKQTLAVVLGDKEKALEAVEDRLKLMPHLDTKYFRAPPVDFAQLKEKYIVSTQLKERFKQRPMEQQEYVAYQMVKKRWSEDKACHEMLLSLSLSERVAKKTVIMGERTESKRSGENEWVCVCVKRQRQKLQRQETKKKCGK